MNDRPHENRRIESTGDLARDFIDSVDFPEFVRDLLQGVFDANLQVTIEQMEAYQELLKAATISVAQFVNAIDDAAAFGYLAETSPHEFSIGIDESRCDDHGSPIAVLTNDKGERLDIGDGEIKAKVMNAKLAMAKEQRAVLRDIILMAATRFVIEGGNVRSTARFDVRAGEKIVRRADREGDPSR